MSLTHFPRKTLTKEKVVFPLTDIRTPTDKYRPSSTVQFLVPTPEYERPRDTTGLTSEMVSLGVETTLRVRETSGLGPTGRSGWTRPYSGEWKRTGGEGQLWVYPLGGESRVKGRSRKEDP